VTLSGTASATATTDANGFYQFTNLASGAYTLTAGGWGTSTNVYSPSSRAITITSADITGQDFASPLSILYGEYVGNGTGSEAATGGCLSYTWNAPLNQAYWVLPGVTMASIQNQLQTAIFNSNSRPGATCSGTSSLQVQDASHWSMQTTCTRQPACALGGTAVDSTNNYWIWQNY
jgi:hypothetical protein